MVSFKILAGGWATYVVTYLFNSDTNELTLQSKSQTGSSPSWLTSHNSNPSIVYSTNEIGPIGNLQSFKVANDGTIKVANTVATGGNGPTFAAQLSTGEVTALNVRNFFHFSEDLEAKFPAVWLPEYGHYPNLEVRPN
jgi:6-phosphogluconolactonase (cycloisomerase 2 family)